MTAGATTPVAGRVDHTAVRRGNLALVLRALRSGPRTRTRLAADTRLTKATVSSLVGDLADRGLARTHEPTRDGAVGRPGRQVELVSERVVGLGLELNVDYIAAVALDLAGGTRASARTAADVAALTVDQAVERAAGLAEEVAGRVSTGRTVLAGVGVAVPGLVDVARGVLRVAPNLHWRDVPFRALLADRLAVDTVVDTMVDTGVTVDNEANLATLAEHATATTGSAPAEDRDLVYVTGGVGVGGGIVADGRVVRGSAGFAGEVGHLAVRPDGELCGCGRRGCWETVCGLGALLTLAADEDDPVRDPRRDLGERLDLVLDRACAGEPRTLAALDQVGHALGLGASMLVNLTNPAVLVLGGYFARLGEFLLAPVRAELAERVVAPDLGGCRVELSRLGLTAAATGAAYAALQPVLDDPALVPVGQPPADRPTPNLTRGSCA